MSKIRGAPGIWAAALLLSACSTGGTPTTEALLVTSLVAASPTNPATTTLTDVSPPLVPAGCAVFDPEELGTLTPIGRLALVESRSESENLTCNFVGTADGLDTGVRIQIDLLTAHADGHFSTAGQFESLQTLDGVQGVSFGRGSFRAPLDSDRGITIVVTIRKLSSSAVPPRDGEFLDIRNNIVSYVTKALK